MTPSGPGTGQASLPARRYPAGLRIIRRLSGGPAVAPDVKSSRDIRTWLLSREAILQDDLAPLFEQLCWSFVAAGIPIDRFSIHMGTLHPQLYGFTWNWYRLDGLCDEVQVPAFILETDSYRRSPLFRVLEYGEVFHRQTTDPEAVKDYPFLGELAESGIVDYMAVPLGGADRYHNAATIASTALFTHEAIAEIRELLDLFALHVERHIAIRIARNVLDAYLGKAAGARVLDGTIERGSGESIKAVIWVSDLRGFTALNDRLTSPQMLGVLNTYFERMVGAIIKHSGEVLKFIGDGLLAVFPADENGSTALATRRALAAAREALAAIDRLNSDPPPLLQEIPDLPPLRAGIALHIGEVFFGNVGAPERLDFTVIGRAVNETSRLEGLTKTLDRPLLMTAGVAADADMPVVDHGLHRLRGVSSELHVFSTAPQDAA
jgi:adenylate cyclase